MAIEITFTDDPTRVLREAATFLAADPVRNNMMLTLLHGRVAHPEPGRYWVAKRDNVAAGVVFQSPLNYPVVVTPCDRYVVTALADAVVETDPTVPGVNSAAATAALFAGRWTETARCGAAPEHGTRLYEATGTITTSAAEGRSRSAVAADRDLLVRWMHGFLADINERTPDPARSVDIALADGRFQIWEDDGPASMALRSIAVEGVARIQAVYTPPELRNRGYAGACVAALTTDLIASGLRCVLYTDLANPTSNSIYRRIGYRAVEESLRYRFVANAG